MATRIIATSTHNPVRGAVLAALKPDNLSGVRILGTEVTVRAVGPLPRLGEDLGWLIRHLIQAVASGTLESGEIVFNRYVAWMIVGPTVRSGRDPATDAGPGDPEMILGPEELTECCPTSYP